jgi:hypothetical protein
METYPSVGVDELIVKVSASVNGAEHIANNTHAMFAAVIVADMIISIWPSTVCCLSLPSAAVMMCVNKIFPAPKFHFSRMPRIISLPRYGLYMYGRESWCFVGQDADKFRTNTSCSNVQEWAIERHSFVSFP